MRTWLWGCFLHLSVVVVASAMPLRPIPDKCSESVRYGSRIVTDILGKADWEPKADWRVLTPQDLKDLMLYRGYEENDAQRALRKIFYYEYDFERPLLGSEPKHLASYAAASFRRLKKAVPKPGSPLVCVLPYNICLPSEDGAIYFNRPGNFQLIDFGTGVPKQPGITQNSRGPEIINNYFLMHPPPKNPDSFEYKIWLADFAGMLSRQSDWAKIYIWVVANRLTAKNGGMTDEIFNREVEILKDDDLYLNLPFFQMMIEMRARAVGAYINTHERRHNLSYGLKLAAEKALASVIETAGNRSHDPSYDRFKNTPPEEMFKRWSQEVEVIMNQTINESRSRGYWPKTAYQ